MANEQTLSAYNVPHINSVAAAVVLANEVLLGYAQKEIEKDGRGITEKFSKDLNGAQVRVIKMKPLTQKARTLGATVNGGNFAATGEFPTTEEFGIDVLNVIDAPINIADVTCDMLPVDVLGNAMKNWTNLLMRNINAATIASHIIASYNASGSINYFVSGTNKFTDVLLSANMDLDSGDETNDIDMFPQEGRVAVIRSAYRGKLYADSVSGAWVGAYNPLAQKMMAAGALSPDAVVAKLEDGYIGDFDGIPVHIAAPLLFTMAEEYAGLPKGSFANVIGYVASDIANARGVDLKSQVQVIPNPDGQGVRILPKVRFGIANFYKKGNSIMIAGASTTKNPLALTDEYSAYTPKLVAPASRQSAEITWSAKTPTVTPASGCTVSIVRVKAASTDVGTSLLGWLADAASGSTWTSGAMTAASGKYPSAMVIMADGTVIVETGEEIGE